MERGEIANIHGRYVILNDKRMIEQTPILSTLLPKDVVEYEIIHHRIHILRVIERKPSVHIGVVKSVESSSSLVSIYIPHLPKSFSLLLPNPTGFLKVFSVILFKATMEGNEILKTYSSIKDRENDRDLFVQLYIEQAKVCPLQPVFVLSNSYTPPIQNLTHLNTFTVDPSESKDFDDAISFDEIQSKIYIHIVDAHRQIDMLGAEEMQALQRAFTLYLPEHVENILSRQLAENDLSLVTNEERKVVTVEFDIDPQNQEVVGYSLYPSIIKVKQRYTYAQFHANVDQFPFLMAFYQRWKRETFNIPHVKLHIDSSNGRLISASLDDYFDDAHRMIETLMILTNLTVSKHIDLPQRYHCRVKDEMTLVTYTGNKTIDAILTIKNYKPAVYDNQQSGHFGLGLSTYTHFTSPIRRYFDVVVHRMLAGVRYDNVDDILAHINYQERFVDKNVVQCYNNMKWLTYFQENLTKLWPGYISTVTQNGATVILEESLYEVFVFSPNPLTVGQKVQIKVKNIDWISLCVKAVIV